MCCSISSLFPVSRRWVPDRAISEYNADPERAMIQAGIHLPPPDPSGSPIEPPTGLNPDGTFTCSCCFSDTQPEDGLLEEFSLLDLNPRYSTATCILSLFHSVPHPKGFLSLVDTVSASAAVENLLSIH